MTFSQLRSLAVHAAYLDHNKYPIPDYRDDITCCHFNVGLWFEAFRKYFAMTREETAFYARIYTHTLYY